MAGFPIPGTGSGVTAAELQDAIDAANARADDLQAQINAIQPFTLESSDPNGNPFARGTLVMATGKGIAGVPSSFVTLTAAGTAWIAGSGGDSPMQVTSSTVPVGTNGVAGYSASVSLQGGSVDNTGKYSTVALAPGSPALPAWATLNKVAGGFTITGTPNAVATTVPVVRVTDLQGWFVDVSVSIQVVAAAQPLAINMPASLPAAQIGVDYALDVVALYVTGGSGTITAASSTSLPNKKIRLDTDGTVTGKVGRLYSKTVAWGGVSDPPNSSATVTVQITVQDSLGAQASQTVSLTIAPAATPSIDISSWVSTDYNKATGVGHYAGTGIAVVPSAVASAVNAIPAGTRAFNTVAGGARLVVGCAAGATSWNGGILTSLCNYDLLGTTPGTQKAIITLAPNQPVNAPASPGQIMAHNNAVTQVLNFELDGNRANQITSTAANPAGCYYTAVRRAGCGVGGGVSGTIILDNIRGVVGSFQSSYNGTGKPASETFCFQDITGAGDDHLEITLKNTDGGTKNNTSSGVVHQYRQIGAPAWNVTLHGCQNQRHGVGCYCGGDGNVLLDGAGTYSGNGHVLNFEAGDTAGNANRAPTGNITVDILVGTGTRINTSGNDLVISCNSNNASGSVTQQVQSLTVSNFASVGDTEFISQSGGYGAPGVVTLTNVDCTPTGAAGSCCNDFSSSRNGSPIYRAENAAALHLNSCRAHLTGSAVASKGGSLAAGQGTWVPF